MAPPTIGSDALYLYPGGTLSVSLASVGVVRDAWGTPRDVIQIDYAFYVDGREPAIINVREHVDRATGLIVRVDSDCLMIGFEQRGTCDARYESSTFAPAGLPGALGMAPAWLDGGTISRDGAIASPFQEIRSAMPTWAPDARRPGCSERVVSVPDWQPFGAWMPMTSVVKPALSCNDSPFPVRWYSDTAFPAGFQQETVGSFERLSHGFGSGPTVRAAPPSTVSEVGEPDVRFAAATDLLADERPYLRFTSNDAHRHLMEHNETYRSRIDAGGWTITSIRHAAKAFGTRAAESALTEGTPTVNGHRWQFLLQSPSFDPSWWQVEKSEYLAPTGDVVREETRAAEAENVHDGPFIQEPLEAPSMDLGKAIRQAVTVLGCSDELLASWESRVDSGAITGMWPTVYGGRLVARVAVPAWENGGVNIPYSVVFDGRTGAVLEWTLKPGTHDLFDENGMTPPVDCE